jgi:hypothetical protein
MADQKTDNAIDCITRACSSAAASSVSPLDRDNCRSRTSLQNITRNETLKMMSNVVIDFSPFGADEECRGAASKALKCFR